MFVLEATSVIFINDTSMVLSGLPNNAAYVQYPPRVNAGTLDTVRPSSRHPAVILLGGKKVSVRAQCCFQRALDQTSITLLRSRVSQPKRCL